MLIRVCFLLDEPTLRRRLLAIGAAPDVLVVEAVPRGSLEETLKLIECDVVIAGRGSLPEPVVETVRRLHSQPDAAATIVLSRAPDAAEAAELLAAGCLAVIDSEVAASGLEQTLLALIGKHRDVLLDRTSAREAASAAAADGLTSHNKATQQFLDMAKRVAAYDASVLILGETGVGKEHLARNMHRQSKRSAGPFVAVNCGGMPETLLESMLFGHVRGAFTGADKEHRGYFELAHRGTVFLDEIAEMPAHLQVRLLRVLQEREIQRLGAEKTISIDVRVLAATNRDLEAEMAAGRFRRDLYYRLCVVTLAIPPLRKRREDIAPLARKYFSDSCRLLGRAKLRLGGEALNALVHYHWPGNIRHLMNVLERAVMLCVGDEVGLDDLPQDLVAAVPKEVAAEPQKVLRPSFGALDESWLPLTLGQARRSWQEVLESSYLRLQLEAARGRVGAAADRAGIDRRSLYAKMKHHGLRKEDFKPAAS